MRPIVRRRAWWLALVMGPVSAGAVAVAPPAAAFTFRPANVGELVSAINDSNTNGQDDVIDLEGNTFTLTAAAVVGHPTVGTRGLPPFRADGGHTVELRNGTIVRDAAAPSFGLVSSYFADLSITSVTLSGGRGVGSPSGLTFGDGGGLHVTGGRLTLTDVRVTGNAGFSGGGILLSSGLQAELTRTEISGNTATNSGGALYMHSNVTIRLVQSTVRDNVADAFAGGLMLGDVGTAEIIDSTVAGNRTNTGAGGIFANGIDLTIERSTLSGNVSTGTSAYSSSALSVAAPRTLADLVIRNSTIVDPGGPSGPPAVKVDSAGTVTWESSTVSTAGAETVLQSGAILRAGSNLFAGGPCVLSAPAETLAANLTDDAGCPDATRVTTAELGLSGLGPNGGPTETMAIGASSRAYNAGDPATCAGLAIDQRGQPRAAAGQCDAGAYELQPAPAGPAAPSTTAPRGTATTTTPGSGPPATTTPSTPAPIVAGTQIESGVLPRTGGSARPGPAAVALALAVAAGTLRRRVHPENRPRWARPRRRRCSTGSGRASPATSRSQGSPCRPWRPQCCPAWPGSWAWPGRCGRIPGRGR